MEFEQFKKEITRPDLTDQDVEALFAYGQNEAEHVDPEDWEVFLEEINEGEWEVNPPEIDLDDDSDVEEIQVADGRRLVRIV
jgi:hypothetical protein